MRPSRDNSQAIWSRLGLIVYLALVAILGLSVITSGIHYTFDADEWFNSQVVYLIAHGYKPFGSFYMIYSPLFHFVLQPIYQITGFVFSSLLAARIFMVGLLTLRIFGSVILARLISGPVAALLVAPMMLLDPFTVFSGMQIRSDNLMLLLLVAALVLLTWGLTSKRAIGIWSSGFILAWAVLTNIKITPAVFVILVTTLTWSILQKQKFIARFLIFGVLTFGGLFLAYFIWQGTFPAMVQQMFLDPPVLSARAVYRTQFGFLFQPDNIFIWGLAGRPLTWVYGLVLPLIGFAGFGHALHKFISLKNQTGKHVLWLALALALPLQWLSLFYVNTVFAQYYMPSMWLSAFLGAIFIADMLHALSNQRMLRWGLTIALMTALLAVGRTSVRANYTRSRLDNTSLRLQVESRWRQIPAGAYVFPDYLFRPLAYPLAGIHWIGFNSQFLLDRYPPIESALLGHKVQYLLLSDFALGYLPGTTRNFIASHYQKAPGDSELYLAKVPF